MNLARFRRIAAAGVFVLGIAPAVLAQNAPAEFDAIVLPGWTFTPGVSFSGMWDSNVALAGRPAQGERLSGDQVLVLVPFGQLRLESTQTSFTAGYRGYMRRYLDAGQLNGFDQRAFVSLRHMTSPRLTVFAQNEFADMPTTDQVELNGLPFARVGSRSNRIAAGVEARLTNLTTMAVRYENNWTAFDEQSGILSGGTINGVGVNFRRRVTERAAYGAEARIRRSDMTRLDPRVIWFQDAGGTFDYRLTEHVVFNASAGFSHLRDSRVEETKNAPYYRLELQRNAERITAGVAFERAYTPSFSFSGSNNNQELRGFVHMPFSRNRFYVQSSGLWRRSDPFFVEGLFGDLLVSGEIRLDTFITSNTIGYSATRWLRAEAYHSFSRQDSIITGGEVNRHRVGAQVVISQPMRIR